jgi:hypothetical protein
LKVLYAPHKAFKEILKNPKYIGPILIMILFLVAEIGFAYILGSKSYNEQTLPSGSEHDVWTESTAFWASNALVSESTNALSGGYYGNKSIQFSAVDDRQIWMTVDFNQTVNCSGPEGWKNMSFRAYMAFPNTTNLESVMLFLNSSQTDYFGFNITQDLVSAPTDTWINLTVPVGPDSGWRTAGSPDWGNITDLTYNFTWTTNANLTVMIDGLFLRGVFASILTLNGTNYMASTFLNYLIQFFLQWFLTSIIVYAMARAFRVKLAWRNVFILVGFTLIVSLIVAVISVGAVATLPKLYLPLEFSGGVPGDGNAAYNTYVEQISLASQITGYANYAGLFWTVALLTFATRALTEFSWNKSILVAVVAYFLSIILIGFLLSA